MDGSGSIINWLRSRGHRVEGHQSFEERSCATKKRYSIEPLCTMNERVYPCRFCQGWHKATKRDNDRQ